MLSKVATPPGSTGRGTNRVDGALDVGEAAPGVRPGRMRSGAVPAYLAGVEPGQYRQPIACAITGRRHQILTDRSDGQRQADLGAAE